jgi:hypothetical protein
MEFVFRWALLTFKLLLMKQMSVGGKLNLFFSGVQLDIPNPSCLPLFTPQFLLVLGK